MSRFPLVTTAMFAGLLVAAGPAAASPSAWTIYGDVIVEVVGPKDQHSRVVLRPR